MLHNFKYSLIALFKNKTLIFWTFVFPILMVTFFNMALKDLSTNEKLDTIDIAIIDNEEYPFDEKISGLNSMMFYLRNKKESIIQQGK